MMLWAAKAWAYLAGKPFVTPDEVKAVAKPALRHRVALRPEVELEGVTADGVLDGVLAAVPVHGEHLSQVDAPAGRGHAGGDDIGLVRQRHDQGQVGDGRAERL